MSNHTPGPWECSWGYSGPIITADAANNSKRIATVRVFFPDFSEEDTANARLIAAAPDLLAALKWALSNINCEPFEWSDEENSNAHEAALAAIAKARGE